MAEEETEGTLTSEEIVSLQERASRVEELETSLKEKDEALGKLENKDFNFRKFEKAKKEEREKMLEDFSDKEKILMEKVSSIEEKFTSSEQTRLDEAKSSVFGEIGAGEELQKKLEDTVKHFLGQPQTPHELKEAYRKAYRFIKSESGGVNPISQFAPVTGSHDAPDGKRKRFTDTPEGRALFKDKFGIEADKGEN